jgi:hypothetical protein
MSQRRPPPAANHEQAVLDIKMYTFRELLDLFNLTDSTRLTEQDMKGAKRSVLHMHPDKSRLPPEYFLFYQQAYQVILDFYVQQQRVSRPVPTTPVVYDTDTVNCGGDRRGEIGSKGSSNGGTRAQDPQGMHVGKAIGAVPPDRFQQTFNQLFDEHMTNDQLAADRTARNQWFTNVAADEATAQDAAKATSVSAVHEHIESYKKSQAEQALTMYRGVQDYGAFGTDNHKLYNDDEGGVGGNNIEYASCDPFAKLKYDDLRKVHRDQTVFAVSGERDLVNRKQYGSHKDLEAERSGQTYSAMDKAEAERLLKEQERAYMGRIQKQEYTAKLQMMEYEAKNDAVKAHFLRLGFQSEKPASTNTSGQGSTRTSSSPPRRIAKNCPRTR